MTTWRGVESAATVAALHAAANPTDAWDEAAMARFLAKGARGLIDPGGVGFALIWPQGDTAELLQLAVAPAARRRGIARALLTRAAALLAQEGVRTLILEVAADNAAAQALYQGMGFTTVGRRRAYYASGADALVLHLDLTGS